MRTKMMISLAGSTLAGTAAADPEIAPGYYHHMMGWDAGFLGIGMMILFWGGLIVLVVLAVRWLGDEKMMGRGSKPSAMDVLRDRFARGEIDLEDFEARKKALND